jgi:hypothetical protein
LRFTSSVCPLMPLRSFELATSCSRTRALLGGLIEQAPDRTETVLTFFNPQGLSCQHRGTPDQPHHLLHRHAAYMWILHPRFGSAFYVRYSHVALTEQRSIVK